MILFVLSRSEGTYRLRWREIRFHGYVLRGILRIGLPSALQSAITAFSNVFVQSYINVFGSSCAAGWSIYGKLDQFALLPLQSISIANTTFVGQNLGAMNIKRAKRGTGMALLIGMGCTAVLMVPLMVFARPLLSLFNQEPEVLRYGQMFVLWISPFYLFCCCNDILGGALRGAGESVAAMVCMLMSFVVSRQIYLYIVSRLVGEALWVGMGYPLGWVLCCLSLALCYKLIPWEKKQRNIFAQQAKKEA